MQKQFSFLSKIFVLGTFLFSISHFIYPHLSKDLCLSDEETLSYREDVLEVLGIFQKYNMNIQLSCDFFSVRVSFSLLPRGIMASTYMAAASNNPEAEHVAPLVLTPYRFMQINQLYSPLYKKDRRLFKLTLIHEIGHLFGVGHIGDPNNIMFPSMNEDNIESLDIAVLQIREAAGDWAN